MLAAEAGVTRILAGGTDVLVQLKSGMVEPDLIVDIKKIAGMMTLEMVEFMDQLPKRFPGRGESQGWK